MKVRVKAPHGNAYGAAWAKKAGDTYGLPDEQAAALIVAGLVEPDGIKVKPVPKPQKSSKRAKPLAAEVEAAGGAHHGSA